MPGTEEETARLRANPSALRCRRSWDEMEGPVGEPHDSRASETGRSGAVPVQAQVRLPSVPVRPWA